MNEQNDFEKQVEQEERAQSEPEIEVEVEYEQSEETKRHTSEMVEKVKELVRKGNVTKIVIKKGENVLVNIPLNVGIVGGIFGVAAAPWAVVAAAVATAGFDCRVEVIKADGETVGVNGRGIGRKMKDMGSAVAGGLRDAIDVLCPDDAEVETVEDPVEEFTAEPEAAPGEPEEINIPVEDPTEE